MTPLFPQSWKANSPFQIPRLNPRVVSQASGKSSNSTYIVALWYFCRIFPSLSFYPAVLHTYMSHAYSEADMREVFHAIGTFYPGPNNY